MAANEDLVIPKCTVCGGRLIVSKVRWANNYYATNQWDLLWECLNQKNHPKKVYPSRAGPTLDEYEKYRLREECNILPPPTCANLVAGKCNLERRSECPLQIVTDHNFN